jgi:SAM-dependent methyltransferase
MGNTIDRATFESIYAGNAPWDTGKPHEQFVGIADRVVSPVLDAGCGTGAVALFFAARGHRVTGIDFVKEVSCFSDEEPGTDGPRRVSRREIYDAFADGWEVESIQPSRFEVNPEGTGMSFSAGGPKTWFAVVRRRG